MPPDGGPGTVGDPLLRGFEGGTGSGFSAPVPPGGSGGFGITGVVGSGSVGSVPESSGGSGLAVLSGRILI